MNHALVRLLMLTIPAIIIVSCSADENVVLGDMSCSPPCWEKIMPGISNEKEVNSILQGLPEVKTDSIRNRSMIQANDSITFEFTPDVGGGGGIILIKGGIVEVIEFEPGKGSIQFNNAISKFGKPEKMLSLYFRGERTQLATYLLYPTKGIALLNIQVPFKGERSQIEPDHPVEAFWYFDPKLFNELMTGGFISNHPLEVIQKGMHAWKGYGEYDFIQTDW